MVFMCILFSLSMKGAPWHVPWFILAIYNLLACLTAHFPVSLYHLSTTLESVMVWIINSLSAILCPPRYWQCWQVVGTTWRKLDHWRNIGWQPFLLSTCFLIFPPIMIRLAFLEYRLPTSMLCVSIGPNNTASDHGLKSQKFWAKINVSSF